MLTVDHDAVLPEDLAQNQVISLADVERSVVVQELRSAGYLHHQTLFFGPQFVSGPKQQRQPGVREHGRVLSGLVRGNGGVGQHVVQHAPDADHRIPDRHADAASQGIRHQQRGLSVALRNAVVRDVNDVVHGRVGWLVLGVGHPGSGRPGCPPRPLRSSRLPRPWPAPFPWSAGSSLRASRC